MQGGCQRAAITFAKRLKPPLESLLIPPEESHFFANMLVAMIFILGGKKIHRQGWHDGSRPEIGGKHSENHRLGKRHEEEFRHSRQEEHGNKDNADTNR